MGYNNWNNESVCEWLTRTNKFTTDTIESFKTHSIEGDHLDLLYLREKNGKYSYLKEMGISLNNRLSFTVQFNKLKSQPINVNNTNNNNNNRSIVFDPSVLSNGQNNSIRNYTSNIDNVHTEEPNESEQALFDNLEEGLVGMSDYDTKETKLKEEKEVIEKWNFDDISDWLKNINNDVLPLLLNKWKVNEITGECILFTFENKDNQYILGLDTFGKKRNFEYQMSLLLRANKSISNLLIDSSILENSVEEISVLLNDNNLQELAVIFHQQDINGIALLSINSFNDLKSLGITDYNVAANYLIFYKSLFNDLSS